MKYHSSVRESFLGIGNWDPFHHTGVRETSHPLLKESYACMGPNWAVLEVKTLWSLSLLVIIAGCIQGHIIRPHLWEVACAIYVLRSHTLVAYSLMFLKPTNFKVLSRIQVHKSEGERGANLISVVIESCLWACLELHCVIPFISCIKTLSSQNFLVLFLVCDSIRQSFQVLCNCIHTWNIRVFCNHAIHKIDHGN